MYRFCLILIISFYSLKTHADCKQVAEPDKTYSIVSTTQQLIGALNALNQDAHVNIALAPGIYQFSENQQLPAINSHVTLFSDAISGNRSGPVIFEGLKSDFRRGPVTFATIGECGVLHLSDIIFRNFSGQLDSLLMIGTQNSREEISPFIWNKGELRLNRIQFIEQSGEGEAIKNNPVAIALGLQETSFTKKTSVDDFSSNTQTQSIGSPKFIITYINPLILNEGHLLFDSVAVSNFLPLSSHTVYNYGTATIQNSYLEEQAKNKRGSNFPVVIKAFSGELAIDYTTFAYSGSDDPWIDANITFLESMDNNLIKVSNSVFQKRHVVTPIHKTVSLNCGGEGVVSLGYNISDDDSCSFTATSDLENTNSMLKKIVNKNSELISVPYFGLTTSSPAVDSASQIKECGSSILRSFFLPRKVFDGNHDGEIRCDRGWPEFAQTALSNGGVNGVFYNSQSDGHYLTVVDNDFNILVIWNTFNLAGEPQWIYAVGELENGRAFVGDAYVNEGGRLLPGGEMEPANAMLWGSFQIEFDSCDSATVKFQSNRNDFGSGEFKVQRLARVKQLGCSE